ncbi:M16 family metallopeptidase [Gelidibacter salicanalis]|uniref:Insulinase family protein n=1 Tax=Gelidibacter salicanalis TaxID=291193 RepID=A0A934KJ91_9FLAO|nr:insulinase family protein [Gelidibacter salicanalis]MBJ7880506.1 insulinase family protein [Gelidibacter salicanalis]
MKNLNLKYSLLIIFVHSFLWGSTPIYSSTFTGRVSLDPEIRHGVLSNGLTYYIKDAEDGSSKIDMRLVVKAGSALLDPDQYELQHVLEHVAFKAGKHMTMGKANSLGLKLGEINGNTSFNFVQYYIKSTYTQEKRDIAFQLFQDIIWDLEIKEEYVDSERSVINNELAHRGRFRASAVINGLESGMIGRSPETPKDIVGYINSFSIDPLKRYYKDWYRPDLMAIVVVGDMDDVDEMEKEIKLKFSRDKPIKNPRSAIIDYSNYRNLPPQFISLEHPYLIENSKSRTVYLRLNLRQKTTLNEDGLEILKNEQQRKLLIEMLGDRLIENQDAYNTNFNVISRFIHPPELGLQLNFTIEGGSEKMVLMKTMQTLRQLRTTGFTKEEFKEGKKKLIGYLSKTDTTKIPYWADNILSHFVYDIILPPHRMTLLEEIVTNLTFEEFNRFIATYLKTDPDDIDIIVLAPPRHRMLSYSEKTFRNWISEANELSVAPYSKLKTPKELIKPSTLANLQESAIQKISLPLPGTKEYLFGNGVRVVLKTLDTIFNQNTKQQNSIRFHGFTSAGVRCYPQEDYFSALNSAEIVRNSGVGGLNKFELKKYLDSKDFKGSISPYIEYDEAGIRGSVSLEDLETALQLVYLYFTSPNSDSLAFEDWKLKATSSLVLKSINKDDFRTRIRTILGDYTYLPKGTKALEGVTKTDMDRAFTIFNKIFGNAGDFTFIFTGNFPENKVLALSQKYLGNLPIKIDEMSCNHLTTKRVTLPKPLKTSMPSTGYMQEAKVQLGYISALNTEDLNWKKEAKLKLLQFLMNFSIMQEMRFNSEEGGSYNISVWLNLQKSRVFNEVIVDFSCSKEDADRLIKVVKQFVESFNNNTIDAELLDEYKNTAIRFLELEKNEKNAISEKLYDYYKLGRPWHSIEEEQEYIKSLLGEDLRNMARRLLNVSPFQFKMLSAKAVQ